jgi:hypothetical protein
MHGKGFFAWTSGRYIIILLHIYEVIVVCVCVCVYIGDVFCGEWIDGIIEGHGTKTLSDGTVIKGIN